MSACYTSSMNDLKARVETLSQKLEKLWVSLNLAEKKKRLAELEKKSVDENLWRDPDLAKAVMQELTDLKKEVDETEVLTQKARDLSELAEDETLQPELEKEVALVEKTLAGLELKVFLGG